MKKTFLSLSAFIMLFSCGSSDKTSDVNGNISINAPENTKESNITTKYNIKSDNKNKLKWTGSAVGKSHYGSVGFDGYLNIENGVLKSGEITFDLTSISSEDLEGDWKKKLDNHLKDTAFFFTDKYPTASLKITKFDGSNITGDLSIKDVTKEIIFPATVSVSDSVFVSTSSFTIDRTEYGIVYASANFFDLAKDKVISDDITFDVSINTKK
tara:strand:+ start:304 stop:939 length:636 start_codon:yes stop_codon:yes gene_type:complete